jgi:hypothetical protein
MTRTNRLLVIFNILLATILVLVLIQFAPSVANANSTTIVACANKKTGALRIAYKACSKKENNVTWGVTGPQGATGAAGPQGAAGANGATGATGAAGQDRSGYAVVKDANGNTVSGVIEIFGETRNFFRIVDGGIWYFSIETGLPLENDGDDPFLYKNSSCTGERIMGSPLQTGAPSYLYNLQKRFPVTELGGESKFYRLSSTTPVALSGYTHLVNYLGNCVAFAQDYNPTFGFNVTEITQLPSLPAPLTISAS